MLFFIILIIKLLSETSLIFCSEFIQDIHIISHCFHCSDSTSNGRVLSSRVPYQFLPQPSLDEKQSWIFKNGEIQLVVLKQLNSIDNDISITTEIYGFPYESHPNYVTFNRIPSTSNPKECLVFCTTNRNNLLEKARKRIPKGLTCTYPTNYNRSTGRRPYPQPNGIITLYLDYKGKQLQFQRGHCISHIHTLKQNTGVLSTKDPINFVPQVREYNRTIRNHYIEKKQTNPFIEIAVYNTPSSTVNATPIPEGFFIAIFDSLEQNISADYYFFPNIFYYQGHRTKKEGAYARYMEIFKLEGFQQNWINAPIIAGNLNDFVKKEFDISQHIYIRIPYLFNNIRMKLLNSPIREDILSNEAQKAFTSTFALRHFLPALYAKEIQYLYFLKKTTDELMYYKNRCISRIIRIFKKFGNRTKASVINDIFQMPNNISLYLENVMNNIHTNEIQ